MIIELSSPVYLALCGLVQDALQHPSDATPLLNKAAQELASAMNGGMIPAELLEPSKFDALRRLGTAE